MPSNESDLSGGFPSADATSSGHRLFEPGPLHVRTWADAEVNAARWMRYWGYADARTGPGGADGGLDVIASGAVAQVKFRAAAVGRPDLQRLVGAARVGDDRLLFFTGTGYSREARLYADERRIALFTYTLDGAVTPTNPHAVRVMTRALAVGEPARAGITEEEGDDRSDWVTFTLILLLVAPLVWVMFRLPGLLYALTFWTWLAGCLIYARIRAWWEG